MTAHRPEDDAFGHWLRAVLYLALGVSLALTPAFAGAVSQPIQPTESHTYEAVEVVPDGRSIGIDRGPDGNVSNGPIPDLQGIDCTYYRSRLCTIERALLRNGTVRAAYAPFEAHGRSGPSRYVRLSRALYERGYDRMDDGTDIGLEPVSAVAVLENVSVGVEHREDPVGVRRIVERGNATLDHELAEPREIVAVNGSYYVFYRSGYESPPAGSGQPRAALVGAVGFLAGLWSLRRGWVHYDRARGRRT